MTQSFYYERVTRHPWRAQTTCNQALAFQYFRDKGVLGLSTESRNRG